MRTPLLLIAAGLLTACGGPPPPPGPPRPAETPAPSAPVSEQAFAGDAACSGCHAEQAEAHAGSAHARTARVVEEGDEIGGPRPTPPPAGMEGTAELTGTHALGSGRRRVSLLHPHEGELQALPLAWSPSRSEWVDRAAEERLVGTAAAWDNANARFRTACAGCHPIPEAAAGPSIPMSPEEARGLPPGISCEHCHGPGARHGELARAGAAADEVNAAIVRESPDAWQGCAHCHARGAEVPLHAGEALRPADPIGAHRFFDSAVEPLGPNPRFFADGRPGDAHGRLAQSFEQSACFRLGGARCTTCHDPHAGGLRDPDPDASCRSCHAEQAADAAAHARHPVATAPVPLAFAEPRGPESSRAPGCVDCHAPAVLAFGGEDRVRDHAFGNPEPELTAGFAVPDACGACHAGREPVELAAWLDERFPDRQAPRSERAAAYGEALLLAAEGRGHLAAEPVAVLAALLADESASESLRVSAANALGALGPQALDARPALDAAASSASPALASAALGALGRLGEADGPELLRLARGSSDWRVRLAAAAALDRLGDSSGAGELEVLAGDERLPTLAHAQARLQLGLAFLRRGLLARAAFQLEEAAGLDPTLVPAWLNLGVARVGLDDTEGARLAWYTVLDLQPGHPVALGNLARLNAQ